MEPLYNLLFLLEPASVALISTAVLVVLAAAHRSLVHEKESERFKDILESSITLDTRQALIIPFASSLSLLLMFYLFSSVSQLITAFTAVAAASSFIFSLSPVVSHFTASVGAIDPVVSRSLCGGISRSQLLLTASSTVLVLTWLISGHWILNNILGIAICVAFVSHVKLPNVKVCAMLLTCLFVYDVFWVFFSERFFGANVMVAVATQQAQNPVHTVAHRLNLPVSVSESITKKLDLPVKLLFPRDLLRSSAPSLRDADGGGGGNSSAPGMDFMMLGLGDMAIPGMLLALVLSFEHRKARELHGDSSKAAEKAVHGGVSFRGFRYVWCAAAGYAVGLIAALGAGILTRSPQPALLYLVPSTLGPVAAVAWSKRELLEIWHGSARRNLEKEKAHVDMIDP